MIENIILILEALSIVTIIIAAGMGCSVMYAAYKLYCKDKDNKN